MKHRASTGSLAGRTSRLGLTALVCLTLVVGGTGSVASEKPVDVTGQPDLAPAADLVEGDTVEEAGAAGELPGGSTAGEAPPAVEAPTPADDEATDGTAPAEKAETAAPAPVASAPARGVAPLAVPRPDSGSAVLTVKVGGDRRSDSAVAPLADVRLRLHDGGSGGPTSPITAGWATCVSDAEGDCTFVVPETQDAVWRTECTSWFIWCWDWEDILVSPVGVNRDRQFWVVQESAPEGWYASPTLVTGAAGSLRQTPYRARTGSQLRAGSTYAVASRFMDGTGTDGNTATGGRWQVSRANPRLPQTCDGGIDVALVLDLSGSVSKAGAVDDLRDSAIAFAEALEGTGSRLSLFTFADSAPRSTAATGRNYPELLPVDGNLARIRTRINSYTASGGTNWDRGILQVAQDGQSFDLAIVIADGMATYSGKPVSGSGSTTRLVETEQAIFSANALKAEGTRVLAVGVGDGVRGEAHNLRAVSGPTAYVPGTPAGAADYVQTEWRQLADMLETLAMGATC